MEDGKFITNHHGGILGGITTGEDVIFRAPFKPTSSIKQAMKTMTLDGKNITSTLDENARHDPCVALRAPVIVEAMTALVFVDFFLLMGCSKIEKALM
jgi:chorismate synthase